MGVNSSVVSQNERDIDILDNEKFVVYEGMFDKLFSIVLCEKCFQRVLTKLRKASIHFKLYCADNHLIID